MKKPITIFVSISLVCHLLFGLWWISQPAHNISIYSNDELSVQLTQEKILTSKRQQIKNTNLVKSNASLKQKTHKLKNKELNKKTTQVNKNTAFKDSLFRSKIIAQLKNKFSKNFYYPRLAQRKNWHGTVTLGVLINTSGEIKDIVVASSSGFSILDDAAIQSMSKIKALNTAPLNKNITIQLPVIYRLIEG